jgi:hypothetical protein
VSPSPHFKTVQMIMGRPILSIVTTGRGERQSPKTARSSLVQVEVRKRRIIRTDLRGVVPSRGEREAGPSRTRNIPVCTLTSQTGQSAKHGANDA